MPEASVVLEELVDVGPLDELGVKEFRMLQVGGTEIGVIRLPDDSVHAIRNVCPHKGAPVCAGEICGTMVPSAPGTLEYGLDDAVLRCPWHGFEYEISSGRELFNGHTLRLVRYAVTIQDGRVYVDARRPLRITRSERDGD